MSDNDLESISIDETDSAFLLVRVDVEGNETTLEISEANIFGLTRLMPDVCRKLLLSRQTDNMKASDISPVLVAPVSKYSISVGIHQDSLILGFLDEFGNVQKYSLPAAVAIDLGNVLPAHLAKLKPLSKQ